MKIAAVLIVKNEEKMLSRCLASVKDFDYIIVCDTGSTDNTVQVAKEFTDLVYADYEWEDSFCKARNHALSKVPKDVDWILSIDADEYLVNTYEQVKIVLEQASSKVVNVKLRAENTGAVHNFTRLFKKDPEIFWVNDAHNLLNKNSREYSDIEVVYGYSPAHAKDPDRTMRILMKSISENPNSVREKYYLAREYYYRKWWQKAIDMYDEYIKDSDFIGERNDAWLMRARCLAELKKYGEACDSAWQALKYNANFKEALVFIGNHMDSANKQRWLSFANLADNRNVLFVREQEDSLPMDLNPDGLFFFENLLKRYTKLDVLEWGSGRSTKYFPEFLKKNNIEYTWHAMEHHKGWYDHVRAFKTENVTITLADKDSDDYLKPEGEYDIIYIDGRNRVKCLQHAKKILKPGGFVLLHDAQREKYQEGFKGYDWRYIGSKEPLLWVGQLEPMETIPKIIHQIWIGPKDKPETIVSWQKMNPGFEYRLWTEKEIDELGLINKKAYRKYYKDGWYAGASNVARVEILDRFGGVYVDADTKCVTSLENAPFMVWDFFASYVVDGETRLSNSPIGCTPGHRYMKDSIERIKHITEYYPSHKQTGPALLTSIVDDKSKVLPAYAFLPVFHRGHINEKVGLNYSEHYWGTTKDIREGVVVIPNNNL
jgi:glycosyltransferase involved in cell wall biosynthesis